MHFSLWLISCCLHFLHLSLQVSLWLCLSTSLSSHFSVLPFPQQFYPSVSNPYIPLA